jgi:hypothetical protein
MKGWQLSLEKSPKHLSFVSSAGSSKGGALNKVDEREDGGRAGWRSIIGIIINAAITSSQILSRAFVRNIVFSNRGLLAVELSLAVAVREATLHHHYADVAFKVKLGTRLTANLTPHR